MLSSDRSSRSAFRQTRLVATALLIAAGLLLAIGPVSALGQSGVDQYGENVPPAPGDDDASATQTETDSSGDTSSAESVDDAAPAEEAEVTTAPAPTEAAPTETLPVTGTEAAPFALLGAAFVLVGVSLLAATRSVRRLDGSPIFIRRAGRWGRPR
jgi:hypothetical protein